MKGSLRAGLKRAAVATGMAPTARDVLFALQPAATKRDRLDHRHMALLVTFLLGPEDNCVDIGANRGFFLEEVVRIAPGGQHIAYEPIPHLCAEVAGRFPQVDVRNAAVADAPGEAEFLFDRTYDGLSSLERLDLPEGHEVETLNVRVDALDAALPEGYVPRLIKLDIEGAEYPAMRGAIETIRRHRPVVLFELWNDAARRFGYEATDVHELLCDEAGLRIFDLQGEGPYSRAEFQRVFEEGAIENFVAHP